MPEDFAVGVDEECSMQGLVFEVVIGIILAEDFTLWIGEESERHVFTIFGISLLRFLKFGHAVSAHTKDIESGGF